jgi:hypothetical protein
MQVHEADGHAECRFEPIPVTCNADDNGTRTEYTTDKAIPLKNTNLP